MIAERGGQDSAAKPGNGLCLRFVQIQAERSVRTRRTTNEAVLFDTDLGRQKCTCLTFRHADGSTPNQALRGLVGKLSTKPVDTLVKSNV